MDPGGASTCSVSLARVLGSKRSWNPALHRCHGLASWGGWNLGSVADGWPRLRDTQEYIHQSHPAPAA